MQLLTFLSAFFAYTAAALSITPDERTTLTFELKQWEAFFGAVAARSGFYPPIQGLSDNDAIDLKLQRLNTSKIRVALLAKKNPHATFSVQTQFALLSHQEFKAYVQKSFGKKKQPSRVLKVQTDEALNATLPTSSVDWTTSKCMPAVKDQGECGSCWAFSATGAAEIGNCIAGGTLYNLAEQQLVDCDSSNYGCDGGDESEAINRIVSNGGLCLASAYPYTSGLSGNASTCQASCTTQSLPHISYSVNIQGESALATALVKQVVTVAVFAGNDAWQYYTGGILSSCTSGESDHAVIAVGYGSNYWKVRNSWGASWGESGYIRLSRGTGGNGTCNIAQSPAYPNLV
ncbi:cysteine protease family C01A [Thraustotheca clavata]|uniref:Cysteine protease family C01A n=1 Tax=Thraustotheca clavata TaxID=74557 RepID=A0A0A7CMD7_9STRA|nr:secreted protein [Thraustotheca clavata]OQR88696.1 cysteine protease family C01A [Thraustotheca clavata]